MLKVILSGLDVWPWDIRGVPLETHLLCQVFFLSMNGIHGQLLAKHLDWLYMLGWRPKKSSNSRHIFVADNCSLKIILITHFSLLLSLIFLHSRALNFFVKNAYPKFFLWWSVGIIYLFPDRSHTHTGPHMHIQNDFNYLKLH